MEKRIPPPISDSNELEYPEREGRPLNIDDSIMEGTLTLAFEMHPKLVALNQVTTYLTPKSTARLPDAVLFQTQPPLSMVYLPFKADIPTWMFIEITSAGGMNWR